jgi:CO dehydrogenase/acetyl-CoA synthase beta subunit
MRIYDPLIFKIEELFAGITPRKLSLTSSWKEERGKVFVFPEDAALELGGDEPSSYVVAYTSNPDLVKEDEAELIGEDANTLRGNAPFAHLVFIRLKANTPESEQECYRILRDIEYQRYQVKPEGYMVRVNTNEIKEGGRLSKDATNRGFSFCDLAASYAQHYHSNPYVEAVRQIFITDPRFPWAQLKEFASLNEGITLTLDHILKTLKMDCRVCSFKSICDTVEGMREIHQQEKDNDKANK